MRRFLDAGIWRQRTVALCVAAAIALPGIATAAEPAQRSFAQAARDSAQQAVAKVWSDAQDVAGFALGLIGVEYRWGGDTPARGLDCSGLIRYVFQEVTGVTLPRTARELSRLGDSVPLGDLRAGDLVFFNTRHFAFSHVGLYLGDNQFIHAPSRGREVEITMISSNYWQKHFDGARRLVGVLPALVPSVIPEALAAAPPAPVDAPANSEPAVLDAAP
jgi:cell wall-associated NlpC family hydrolase